MEYISLRLAFCLFKYFPFGGQQRDFLRIARECKNRGHEIHVYTTEWEGEREMGFHLHLVNARAWQNHARMLAFANKVKAQLANEHYDAVIGFNKMPYLDIYYAADICYQARVREHRRSIYRLLPRYRQHVAFEEAVFAAGQPVEILLISPLQQIAYEKYYHTEPNRFHLLPPGIDKSRTAPANAADIRARLRAKFKLTDQDKMLLMVGSGFKTKGVDRTIRALAALPDEVKTHCKLFVLGQDDPAAFQALARKLQVNDRITFLGGRTDVPDFLLAADLLVHPSYHENTGTVILEAMVSGLPVLTVAACGYAHYVEDARAGLVVPAPFHQQELNQTLQKMLLSPDIATWRQNGLIFANEADIYSMPTKAADLIEQIGQRRVSTHRT
jgi:UDP-glucose:(heptosyl)LPS alpha-1,3-glucosyltransferase